MKSGILIVISGFSGAGKGTLVNRLITEYDNYALSISMTTRKRSGRKKDTKMPSPKANVAMPISFPSGMIFIDAPFLLSVLLYARENKKEQPRQRTVP